MFPVALSAYRKANANSVGGGVGLKPPEPPLAGGTGITPSPDKGRVGVGFISFSLSFIKTVKPATGILETFFNFTRVTSCSGMGSGSETLSSSSGVVSPGAGALSPNGFSREQKFVSMSPSVGTVASLREYKNPKTAITARPKMIIKSMKFRFDIRY